MSGLSRIGSPRGGERSQRRRSLGLLVGTEGVGESLVVLDLVEVGELRDGLIRFFLSHLGASPGALLWQSGLARAEQLVGSRLLLLEGRVLVAEPEVDFILGHPVHL